MNCTESSFPDFQDFTRNTAFHDHPGFTRNLDLSTALIGTGAFIGILGNVCVILIYSCRMQKRKDDRYFIPCLAFVNLAAIIVSTIFFVSVNVFQTDFKSGFSCKALHFLNRAIFVTTLLMLLIIAVQRYKKICRTFRNRISLFWKRIAILTNVTLGILISIPAVFFYGVTETGRNVTENVTVTAEYRCELLEYDDYHYKAALCVYTVILFILILTAVICITLLYLRIGKQIKKNVQTRSKKMSSSTTSLFSNSLTQNDVTIKRPKSESGMFKVTRQESDLSFPTLVEYSGNGISMRRATSDVHSNSTASNGPKSLNIYRYSYMFFTISLVTFVSYIPPFILIILEAVYGDVLNWGGVSLVQTHVLIMLRRMYFLSYVINPFLFGLFDRTFRRELKIVLSRCRH
ncbi:hypothetical protein FSP39_019343 [Pinctada imbricata]|uniref:G-protein coupled receptors family 1 profile domain-containing protein n=1 Tax=Pinctada imbricata TaxID=66713 RepID=A0AA88YEB0_PINIB|nr:hypothetical protein FSP39_019343 [Pinctada imbricata]